MLEQAVPLKSKEGTCGSRRQRNIRERTVGQGNTREPPVGQQNTRVAPAEEIITVVLTVQKIIAGPVQVGQAVPL